MNQVLPFEKDGSSREEDDFEKEQNRIGDDGNDPLPVSGITYEDGSFIGWVAHYGVKKPSYTGTYHIWQYTDTGKVSGAGNSAGHTDINRDPILRNRRK